MAKPFERLKVGDELTCTNINQIYDELERLRKTTAAAPLRVNGFDNVASAPTIFVDLPATGLIACQFPTGMPAGSIGSPASKSDVLRLVESGNGYSTTGAATITVYSSYATAVTGTNKFGYVRIRGDSKYELVLADC